MRFRILRNFGVDLPSFSEGEVRDIEQVLADKLLSQGLIEESVDAVTVGLEGPTVSLPATTPKELVEKIQARTEGKRK